jgi:conjugative transposon TraN protein
MKKSIAIFIILTSLHGFSQTIIPSYHLSLCFQKTTNIIFPYPIKKTDIGSGDVIGQKDARLPNVLFLKANRKGFETTNLSVYTGDGKFYSFIVQFRENPDTLNLLFTKNDVRSAVAADSVNGAVLDSDALIIQNQNPLLYRKTSSQQMKAILNGIYIRDHLMWFTISIKNNSEIDYQPDYIKFIIGDKHTGKRTAVQETGLEPAWRTPDQPISGRATNIFIYAFPVFTIDKHKKLVIQIAEKNGGRLLNLEIPFKTLLKAHSI